MREEHAQQNQDNFKVAPIISDDKLDHFKNRLISTLLGLSTYAHYEFHDKPEQHNKIKIVALIAYLCIPVLIIVPNSVINSWQLHALAVLIPTVLCPIASLITDIITDKSKQIHRYVIVSVYSYLWAVHFFISRQLLDSSLIDSGMYFTLLVLSIITVLTSSSTISFAPVRQFSASTFNYQELNVHSTLNVRFYVVLPVLVTQLGLYYSSMASIHPAIPSLQLIVSLSFLLWILGIISSLYNNILFVINNLLNCLIFGEQITHSGNNFRGQHIWWVPFIILLLNILSIGANIALVLNMQAQGQPTKKIIQSQHIFLVFSSIFTCILTTIIVYFSYRCSKTKQQLIRMDVFNLTQQQSFKNNEDNVGQDQNKKRIYQGKCFINHKQILNLIATILVPVIVCLLGVLAFSQFYNSYGQGQQYNPRTFFAEKTTTWVLLLIDVTVYLIFVIFKELSRARSKLGCTIFPRIFKDFFFKLSLKITGALAIMALTLRIQDIQILAWKILSRTPVSSQPHSSLTFFITYILIPILIYRSYKRSQVFSHFFHITIIVSFSLTIINSTLYYYESVFVVLAMPNFPENPFRLLLISPFTIPKKLVHKNENIYRIAYFLVNIFTFFVYMCSLGTLQFSMLFGLPMYWCVIPSISCQSGSKREKGEKNISQIQLKQTMSDFQTTNQNFKIQRQVNRSTPQHNLYEKIVSEIPFYIFRNKRPGYYLIRISKYILLVEVIADFYGIFQTVSIIGLETQEVTTCHAKEGQTLDRIIDYTWGNPENHQCFSCDDFIKGIIHEEHSVRRVKITAENEIQLTGIIQSTQFYVLFKKCLMKALIFYYNKFLLGNPKNQLRSQQQKQAEVLLQDLYGRVGKQKIDQIFPYQFLQKNNFIYEAKFKQSNRLNLRRKLPPIGKKDEKMKKQKIIDDFADLIGASNSDIIMKNGSVEQKKQVIDIDRVHQQSFIKQNHDNNQKTDKSSLNMAIIISAYLSVIGKINYLNPERLYKLMKKDNSVLSQFQFKAGLELVANSVGCALKIAIGKQLQAEQQVQFDDFANYDKNEYLGILESTGFSDAIQRQKQDIWTVSYNQIKKALAVKRIAKNDTALYMFSLQTHAVQAVWNNLRFQLLFATNDNDQRYSIQTHQYLLRNLLVEGCEQPYGYAGYYSEEFINL